MNKSIVVINTPENCRKCPFRESAWSFCLGEYEKEKHCPLRPLPQKLDANDWHRMFSGLFSEREAKGYGWNACLDEITGETE